MTAERRIRQFFTQFLVSRCAAGAILFLVACLAPLAGAAEPIRRPFEDGVTIIAHEGRALYLECQLPKRTARSNFLKRHLADDSTRKFYQKLKAFHLAFDELKPETQRRVIETLFPSDYADGAGWWHRVTYQDTPGFESWWNLADWLTGRGRNYNFLEPIAENRDFVGRPRNGQVLFIPRDLLKDVFKTPSPARPGRDPLRPITIGDLRYGVDSEGEYAAYHMKQGETIHVNVIGRFTELRGEAAVDNAVARVLNRNNITDPRRVMPGQEIRIPVDMLAPAYQPRGGSGLDGIVIILDAGHGGGDPGKEQGDVFEDEITYDIVLRIKQRLESTTRARIHTTVLDPDHDGKPTTASSFLHDQDELLLTTPNYNPTNTTMSVIMRAFLVNHLFREEVKAGTPKENVFFASIHVDSLPERLSGTMVYIPGAAHRGDVESFDNPIYQQYKEAQGQETITITAPERQDAEQRARKFAEGLLTALRQHQPPITVSASEKPIRDIIIQSASSRYIPGVIRNTIVPTRVLVETANVQNPQDRANLIDPAWRQAYAEAFVEAVIQYFDR